VVNLIQAAETKLKRRISRAASFVRKKPFMLSSGSPSKKSLEKEHHVKFLNNNSIDSSSISETTETVTLTEQPSSEPQSNRLVSNKKIITKMNTQLNFILSS
jgi:hypothetical protein